MMDDYIDPPLEIIRDPKPPQRILLPPKQYKPRSASDMPVYEETAYPEFAAPKEVPVRRSAVLKAGAPNFSESSKVPLEKPAPLKRGLNSGYIRQGPRQGNNWITDMIGKTFDQAITIMRFHHMPYRIVQIDGIMMNNSQKINGRQEILITIATNEGHSPSSYGPGTKDDRERDQLRVSSWFSQNMDKSIVSCAQLST
jgi:hypothetical protein